MNPAKPAPLLWINGFPGSGKLTVAKIIAQLTSDAIILDNHKLIDPVEAKFPRIHPDYQKERHLYRQAIFQEHVFGETTLSKLIVFTGELHYVDFCLLQCARAYSRVRLSIK